MSMNVLPTGESQVCTLKYQSTPIFGQASNTGPPQPSNTKSSSNQASYQKRSHSRKKGDAIKGEITPRTPYSVISSNAIDILRDKLEDTWTAYNQPEPSDASTE